MEKAIFGGGCFWCTEAEAGKYIKEIDGAVTKLEPFKEFFEAENYYKDYYENNKSAPYCQIIINPKLEKVQKEFAKLLDANLTNRSE